jgi:hypothetical protein
MSNTSAPVERKTWAALAGGLLAGAGLYIVDALTRASTDPAIFDGLPPVLRFAVVTLAPGALAFAAAWLARHTPRDDVGVHRSDTL